MYLKPRVQNAIALGINMSMKFFASVPSPGTAGGYTELARRLCGSRLALFRENAAGHLFRAIPLAHRSLYLLVRRCVFSRGRLSTEGGPHALVCTLHRIDHYGAYCNLKCRRRDRFSLRQE